MNLETPLPSTEPQQVHLALNESEENFSRAPKQLLEPGDYFCEVELARPVSETTFTSATDKMGFEEVLIGEIRKNATPEDSTTVTFIGRLGEHLGLIDTPNVRWNLAHRIQSPWAKSSFDSFANLSLKVGFQSLETHQLYEIRFVARMKSEPTLKEVDAELEKMGWYKGSKLCLLKKDTRLPGRPNAACAIWYGLARWRRNHSYITEQDPFYFEDAILLENHPSSPRRMIREREEAPPTEAPPPVLLEPTESSPSEPSAETESVRPLVAQETGDGRKDR